MPRCHPGCLSHNTTQCLLENSSKWNKLLFTISPWSHLPWTSQVSIVCQFPSRVKIKEKNKRNQYIYLYVSNKYISTGCTFSGKLSWNISSLVIKTQQQQYFLSMLKTPNWAPPLVISAFLRGDMESITLWDGNSSTSPTRPEQSLMSPTLSPRLVPHFICKAPSSVDGPL